MRYRIMRVAPGPALRVSLLLGWLVMLCPAMCVAGLIVRALQSVAQRLAEVRPFEIEILGRTVAQVDLLQRLGLTATVQAISNLAQRGPATFILLTLLLLLAGSIGFVIATLLASLLYNLLARMGVGLEVDLQQR